MAMTKAEMEAHHAEYDARMAAARTAERQGLYRAALEAAVSAWDYVDGMMQYERKYQDAEVESITAIDFVLRYAPLLFYSECLDRLDSLLKVNRRIARNVENDLEHRVHEAREWMWLNHKLFTYLEANPDMRQDELRRALGGNQDYWRWVVEAWAKMGLLSRTPEGGSYRVALITRMGQLVPAKCPSCGHLAYAPKAMFFEQAACPECRKAEHFVLVNAPGDGNSEE